MLPLCTTMRLAWLGLSLAAATRMPQPSPGHVGWTPDHLQLTKYIPARGHSEGLRFLSVDVQGSYLSHPDFWGVLEKASPDFGLFIHFSRRPEDFEAYQRMLSTKGYTSRMVTSLESSEGEMMLVSRFPILSVERLSTGTTGRAFAADVVLTVGNSQLHVLAMNLASWNGAMRLAEAEAVLRRLEYFAINRKHFILMGSPGTKNALDQTYQKFKINAHMVNSCAAAGKPISRYTNIGGLPMDRLFVGHSLKAHVQGSYVSYSGDSAPVVLMMEVARRPFASSNFGGNSGFHWGQFSSGGDLFRLMVFWVPIVAIGTVIVGLFGWYVKRRESKNHAVMAVEGGADNGDATIWDTIEVTERFPGGKTKERTASYDAAGTSSGSLYPQVPTVVRILTPPCYPPPAYDEKS